MTELLHEYPFVFASAAAGLIASVACGLGALPLAIRGVDFGTHIGLGYAAAGGLMVAASVYNLLLPALTLGEADAINSFGPVVQTLGGLAAGCAFLSLVETHLTPERLARRPILNRLGGRVEALVFIAMCFHSIPEGVAVGVGYASEEHLADAEGLGSYIAVAISIHNMPEGLAVALPMRAAGASIGKCFFLAFLTSLPQPLAAIPASLLVWIFEPLMLPFLGFAAGAMMFLVIVELIPDGLETQSRSAVAWAFMIGFGLMALVQVAF